jgi:hypothetical protein
MTLKFQEPAGLVLRNVRRLFCCCLLLELSNDTIGDLPAVSSLASPVRSSPRIRRQTQRSISVNDQSSEPSQRSLGKRRRTRSSLSESVATYSLLQDSEGVDNSLDSSSLH